jgi:hypothetical protein
MGTMGRLLSMSKKSKHPYDNDVIVVELEIYHTENIRKVSGIYFSLDY